MSELPHLAMTLFFLNSDEEMSSAITSQGIGVGIEAAKRSGRLVSRLVPDLTDVVLKLYLDSKLGLSVNVECVKATDWHTSFHITCKCENTAVYMNKSIWPEGAYIRWWERRCAARADLLAVTCLRMSENGWLLMMMEYFG